jgi:hypothetical protein
LVLQPSYSDAPLGSIGLEAGGFFVFVDSILLPDEVRVTGSHTFPQLRD